MGEHTEALISLRAITLTLGLIWSLAENPHGFARTPTTPKPSVSVESGFFGEAFNVAATCAEVEAILRYTLDGSLPSADSALYSGPLTIGKTTLLRIVAFGGKDRASEVVTRSYLFLDQVLQQSCPPYDNTLLAGDESNPPLPTMAGGMSFPISWGVRPGKRTFVGQIDNVPPNEIPADYGMDPEIVSDPGKYNDDGGVDPDGKTNLERIREGLRGLPVLSIVMSMENLFGATGLYPNSMVKGSAYEKECSIELLLPDGSIGFRSTCALRIHGNASRNPEHTPKHSFKLKFKKEYGASKLSYQLFPDSPVEVFDDLVLRADYNSSWTHWDGSKQAPKGTRLRDAFCKDTFRAMGQHAGHHRYVHLFLNGLYWGTYDLTEQENHCFSADYFGGSKQDYAVYEESEAIKHGADTPVAGDSQSAYSAMVALPPATTAAIYEQYKRYLDLPEFMDYMLLHFFVGHADWGRFNWIAVRNAKDGGTFKYLPWDMESLLLDETADLTGITSPPSGLHSKLVVSSEYRLDFADRVHKHMIAPDGALLPAANISRWNRWKSIMGADQMACESARWGDCTRDVAQRTPTIDVFKWNTHWIAENRRLVRDYFPVRTGIVLEQLQSRALYPKVDAPEFRDSATGALVADQNIAVGTQLTMTGKSHGIVYFTIDGSDPRIPHTGEVNVKSAQRMTGPLTIYRTTTIKARVLNGSPSATGDVWSALNEATLRVHPGSGSVGNDALSDEDMASSTSRFRSKNGE